MFPNLFNIVKRGKFFPVYLFFLLISSILLNILPLTKDFGYEYSAVNSILITLISALYTTARFNKNDGITVKDFTKIAITVYPLLLLIPFLTALCFAVFNGFCSFPVGIQFYTLITFPSVLIGSAISIITLILFKRKRYLIVIIGFIVIALIPVADIYFYPQVYFYNPIIVFFPGTIYDENIAVDFKFISYRLISILFFLIILYSSLSINRIIVKLRKPILIGSIVLLPILFHFISPYLGFITTRGVIADELPKMVETEHFVIHLPAEIDSNKLKLITAYHEFCLKELADFYKVSPSEKITSFVFTDRVQKAELTGAENADISKPWQGVIFTTEDNYFATLKHEIAHSFTAGFGWGIFKVASGFNPALIEGAAESASPYYDVYNVHYLSALAFKTGFKPDIATLFTGGSFFFRPSSLSYIYAGSFSLWLIENYGVEKFKQYYRTGDFEYVYGVGMPSAEIEYKKFLNTIPAETKDMAFYYFGRATIFSKQCPRVTASLQKKGWNSFLIKNYSESKEFFKQAVEKSSDYTSFNGYMTTLIQTGDYDDALSLLVEKKSDYYGSAYYYNLQLKLADLYALKGIIYKADSLYSDVMYKRPSLALVNISGLRKEVIKSPGLIKTYLTCEDSVKYKMLKSLVMEKKISAGLYSLITLAEVFEKKTAELVKLCNIISTPFNEEEAYSYLKAGDYFLLKGEYVAALNFYNAAVKFNSIGGITSITKNRIEFLNYLKTKL